MRPVGVWGAAVVFAIVAGAVVSPGSTAGAEPTRRAGWWSRSAPAPAAPDAPEGGLHVAGGVNEPTAVAALAFVVPDGRRATTLTVVLAGTSPRANGLQACAIAADAADFEPVQNGPWSDRPAYDCDAGSAPVALDGDEATFDVAALQQGTLLAVALVPAPTDRASFQPPDDASLAMSAPTPAATPSRPAAAAPSADAPAADSVAYRPPVAVRPAMSQPASPTVPRLVSPVAVGDATPVLAAPPSLSSAGDDAGGDSWRTRVGGALGFALLLCALLFYSQGRGLLGARVGNT